MAETAILDRPAAQTAALAVRDLNGWYDESHVLHGMSFDIRAGEVVTLLGRTEAPRGTSLPQSISV